MVDFVITSEHRTGSRWMHYLFSDLLGKGISPEIDVKRLYQPEYVSIILDRFKENKIVKFHHATPIEIVNAFRNHKLNLKILGIVRNPRDQGVSFCFHNRYHKKHNFPEKKFDTDEEALRYTIMESSHFKHETTNMLQYMMPLYHVYDYHDKQNNYYPYIWTNYEWLVKYTYHHVTDIMRFLGEDIDVDFINSVVDKHSFKSKSKRKPGQEKRNDLWRRKGITGDWENHFTEEMLEHTRFHQELYYNSLGEN
jgi:hypothetical protein